MTGPAVEGAAEGDAVEQRQAVVDPPSDGLEDLPLEADPADAVEQAAEVGLDEDDRR